METLTKDNIIDFTRFGLIAICSSNRDICSGYNSLGVNELRQYLLNHINNNETIFINQSIYNNILNLYRRNGYKKKI